MKLEQIIESGCNLNHLNESDEYYLHSIHNKEFNKFPIATREVSNHEAGVIVEEMIVHDTAENINKAYELAADVTFISICNN